MGAPRIDRLDKNYIINGNFDFWQRGISNPFGGTGAASGFFASADRTAFAAQTVNDRANRVVNRSTDVPSLAESGFRSTYSLEYTQTSALVLTAPDFISWHWHKIEGFFYRNLHGKTITFSFMFKSTLAGQYPVSFRNGGQTRSYVSLFTYDVANVWQKIYVTLETDTSGTWLFDNGVGISIIIGADSGGNNDAPSLNTWLNGNYFAAATGVQVQAQTNITINVAQLQLVEGELEVESFSMAGRDYAEELQLCQRYYEKSYDLDVAPGTSDSAGANRGIASATAGDTADQGMQPFKVYKRAAPIIAGWSEVGAANSWNFNGQFTSPGFQRIGTGQFGWFGASLALTIGQAIWVTGHWTADAEL